MWALLPFLFLRCINLRPRLPPLKHFCFLHDVLLISAKSGHHHLVALPLHFTLPSSPFTGPFPVSFTSAPPHFAMPTQPATSPPFAVPVPLEFVWEFTVFCTFVLQSRDFLHLFMPTLLHLIGVSYLRWHVSIRDRSASTASSREFLVSLVISTCTRT
jgi:hypothetical protein